MKNTNLTYFITLIWKKKSRHLLMGPSLDESLQKWPTFLFIWRKCEPWGFCVKWKKLPYLTESGNLDDTSIFEIFCLSVKWKKYLEIFWSEWYPLDLCAVQPACSTLLRNCITNCAGQGCCRNKGELL